MILFCLRKLTGIMNFLLTLVLFTFWKKGMRGLILHVTSLARLRLGDPLA